MEIHRCSAGHTPLVDKIAFKCGEYNGFICPYKCYNNYCGKNKTARLLSAASLRVVESSLTGEADAVAKTADAVAPDADLADRSSMVHRGTSVAQGTGRAVVVATGADTEMGAIARMLDSVEEEGTPLQREITRISKMLGAVVIVIAVVVVATLLALAPERTAQTVSFILS